MGSKPWYSFGREKPSVKNLSTNISPVQLERYRVDLSGWKAARREAEQAYFPFRVREQQMYIDTILNGHVAALMERRQDLTTLRKFRFCQNKVESEVITQQFKKSPWFSEFIQYCLDAEFFGYSLISLGDIIDDQFKDISLVRRWVVSPERMTSSSFIYMPSGESFAEDPYKPWHIYVKTPDKTGISNCGHGLFYSIALYEIFLRNVLSYNGDFVELYSQPYRVGKTTKTTEPERAELAAALQNMGSNGWAIIDPTDEIAFLETALGGTGYKGYESLELRCEKKVSKLILGHSDAIDSTPGKLGGGQGGDTSPAADALSDKQAKDGLKIEAIINQELLPRMRLLGMKIPDDMYFEFSNDDEMMEARANEDAANAVTATIAQTMKNAGLIMDPKYFTERTGIPCEAAPDPVVAPAGPVKPGQKLTNRLKLIYGE